MNYHKLVAGFIERDEIEEMIAWAKLQPPLDQVEILTIFKDRLRKGIFGLPNVEALEQIDGLEIKIDNFQERILDEQMASLQLDFAKRDVAELMKKMLAREGVHQYIVSCIVNNEPNADAMKMFAQKAIIYEKQQGIFNPDNWIGIDY